MRKQAFPKYYNQIQATLRDALLPSFGAGEAIGRLMVAAARGQRSAHELLALREKWAETLGEAPDHQAVNALDYKGISELAENPILSDRDLEALGLLLQKISKAQAENGLSWEFNRKLTGEWLDRLSRKISLLAKLGPNPEKLKERLETLAEEVEKIGEILTRTVPWEDPARERAWQVKKETEEQVENLVEEALEEEDKEDMPCFGKASSFSE
ncbi:hypothetical protein G4V39_02330 [Thermosulfuriphilus ammonigenes]|uniref:Uncharacterized protein n=1 Tax=Thermosulfuriphilus ammonigenes TaxID=1936021 RepID=A0A6G7PU52_9BACT|nr:hypothetical protein [Thermosulfuriphilus ammonigenes]MBA2848680.1 hypothetical protein [Thermosulfuriphilus ammonigenes]QIJ71182.1 hypothetical protein G4V39_02330 [Thermosulfuriphilus ammonigenes]